MLLLLKALIMGIIEGITEFLPISSTGHLIIVGHFLKFDDEFSKMFEIVIQLGAILSVVYFYREKIFNSLKWTSIKPGEWGFKMWFKIFIAFLPAAILGVAFNKYIDKYLFSPLSVAIALVVGAIMILVVEKVFTHHKFTQMEEIGGKNAFLIGLAQCMSLFPGMSRSASTIMGGLAVGLTAKAAAEFSFFLAIPTMVAASGYSLLKHFTAVSSMEWAALAVGFVTSFIVAFLVVGKFLDYLGKHTLKSFAYYRLVVGVLMIALVTAGLVK